MKKLGALFLTAFLITFPVGSFAQKTYGLAVGTQAPDFSAQNYLGQKVTLSDYAKEGPVILLFYRGAWCPYCTLQLKNFQDNLSQFEPYNAAIIAISVDTPEYAAVVAEKQKIDFEIISNPQADILTSYNLVFEVPEDLRNKYFNEYKIDLKAHSGRTDGIIAVPAVFIVDSSQKVVYAYANEDYKIRKSAEDILSELQQYFPLPKQ